MSILLFEFIGTDQKWELSGSTTVKYIFESLRDVTTPIKQTNIGTR